MRHGPSWLTRLLAVGIAAPAAMLGAFAAPAPARAASPCASPGKPFAAIPWQQKLLSPERVWPFTHGGGTTVAVLSTGVDADVPGLRGHVGRGYDAVIGGGRADDDCLGKGTHVAGVIAGQQAEGSGFSGLAPGTTILPVRVVSPSFSTSDQVDPRVLARGITWAVDHGADVIAAPLPAYQDSAALRSAVERAADHRILVIAAAGDLGDQAGGGPRPYPASYPGVLGVAAIDRQGHRPTTSQYGSYVDIAAPGASVVTLERGGGMVATDSTGVACGFVAATAALVLAHRGGMSAGALSRRLTSTATPAADGADREEFGAGVVDPYAAVTDTLVGGTPAALPALPTPSAHTDPFAHSKRMAWLGAGIGVLAALLVVMLAVALPRGRRRAWRSGLAAPPARQPEPEPGPPVLLFEEPERH